MNKLCLAFFCAVGVSYAIPPSTTENDISTFTSPITEKLEDSSKITTFVPSLSAIKPTVDEKKSARYDGDQVLRVFTVNSKHRKKIKEIERENSKCVLLLYFSRKSSSNLYGVFFFASFVRQKAKNGLVTPLRWIFILKKIKSKKSNKR